MNIPSQILSVVFRVLQPNFADCWFRFRFIDQLKKIIKAYYDRMYICEEQKWDLEREVRKRDYEVQKNRVTRNVFFITLTFLYIYKYIQRTLRLVVYRHCFSRISGRRCCWNSVCKRLHTLSVLRFLKWIIYNLNNSFVCVYKTYKVKRYN